MMRSVFYAIYLTDVVGLEPRLTSFGALAGIFRDALNDPLAGMLSDRVRTRWGRLPGPAGDGRQLPAAGTRRNGHQVTRLARRGDPL